MKTSEHFYKHAEDEGEDSRIAWPNAALEQHGANLNGGSGEELSREPSRGESTDDTDYDPTDEDHGPGEFSVPHYIPRTAVSGGETNHLEELRDRIDAAEMGGQVEGE